MMPSKLPLKKPLWVLGGLTLGGLAGLVLGVLVFWVHPTLERARSPIGETTRLPLVLRYLKGSPVVPKLPELVERIQAEWQEILRTLQVANQSLPNPIYLYLYSSVSEVGAGISARLEEEHTPLAVADVLVTNGGRAELGRLVCALAFGRPGNAVVPRGVALYLDSPEDPWAEEAWTWVDHLSVQGLWVRADRLLPRDPWEDLYFQINAPWASATLTLEKMRAVLVALSEPPKGGKGAGEVLAAALVKWIISRFGEEGLRCFWRATSWESAAACLRSDSQGLAQDCVAFLRARFEAFWEKEELLALKELRSGCAERARALLAERESPKAREIKGLAHLALGQVQEAIALLGEQAPALTKLLSASTAAEGPLVIVGESPDLHRWLGEAQAVFGRACAIWPDLLSLLPDRLAFYVTEEIPELSVPWGVILVQAPEEIPAVTARVVLEAASLLGLPAFTTLVEGVALWLIHPGRDFRGEAKALVEKERWVSLTQTLFGVYPKELAEAEAGALVSYVLAQFGTEKLRAFWEAIAEGASPFRASEKVFAMPFYELEARVLAWIRQL